MTISLCHPSRGRATQAYKTFNKWMERCTSDNNYNYILSLDIDDPQLTQYKDLFKTTGVDITINSNRSMVDASNKAAQKAIGDILILVSDDFDCPYDWDKAITGRMPIEPALLHVDDSIQKSIVTLTIMNRALYSRLGYLYYPAYFSMYADNDLTETAKRIGAYVDCLDLLFPHLHWLNGKAKKDATYEKEDSPEAWKIGKALYEKRQADNFPA